MTTCEVCEGPVCKKCLTVLDPETFSFLATIPEVLKHTNYCGNCYDEHVAPALDDYQGVMKRAEGVFVFFITQRKEIPITERTKEFFKVDDCPDRDETILRLAFFAAQLGYNALIEVDVKSKKIINGAYQTSRWSGTGSAAQIDEVRLDKQLIQNKMYR